jgi:lysozyme
MVESHTGKPVLLKVSKAFDAAYGVTLAIPRPVWAVQDFFPPDYPARRWRMWQANGTRRIDGVDGPIHWDVVAP